MASASDLARDLSSVRASAMNCSLASTNAGRPFFVISIVSWTLHDVHDPQFAMPTIAASHSPVMPASVSGVIGLLMCTE
jgi:hypothetical protein